MQTYSILDYTIKVYDSLPSTNEKAKQEAALGAKHKSVYVAKTQSLGKGRLGRTFISSDPNGLYFSILLRKCPQLETITLQAALCICKTVRVLASCDAVIKWPNDIILNGKKICGILTESSFENNNFDFVVVGVGVNLNNDSIDESIRWKASSIYLETGKKFSKQIFITSVLERLNNECFNINEYKKFCVSIGRKVKVNLNNEVLSGTIIDVVSNGNLLICTSRNKKIFINSCTQLNQNNYL